jgi:hypothetical protein
MSAHKRNLRKLAFAVGVVPRDANSLHMSAEEFEEKLVGIYPDIRDLGDDEVTALIADAEAGGTPTPAPAVAAPPAKAPKAKATPAPAPEEVEADPEEEPAPAAAAPAPRRGRPAKNPTPAPVAPAEEEVETRAARPAARPTPKAPVAAAPTSTSDAELSVLSNMVKDIGVKVFDYEASFKSVASKESVDKLAGEVKELRATLKAIAGYLTWQYNSQVDESDAVKSITEVAW